MFFLVFTVLASVLGEQEPSSLSAFSLLGLSNSSFGELLLSFIQLSEDDSTVEAKLGSLADSLRENVESQSSNDICSSQKKTYEDMIREAEAVIKSTQKEIESLLNLIEDTKTYVPEKEQEAEQAKRWSETAKMEIDLEKARFLEKDSNYAANIQACEKALSLLNGPQTTTLIESAKSSHELLQLSDASLNPTVQVLLSLASRRNPENTQEIIKLIQDLLEDLRESRRVNEKNHEGALEGAQAYSEEKYYTYYNLNRQNNIILDNQVKLQQELYHKQLQIEENNDKIRVAAKKQELLGKLCDLERKKHEKVQIEKVDEVKVTENFLEVIQNPGFLGYINEINL